MCVPGEVLESCGYRCNQLCDSMAKLTTACQSDDDTCVPMCKPAGVSCRPGERLKDKNSCVVESLCPCRMQNGTIAKVCGLYLQWFCIGLLCHIGHGFLLHF